MTIAVCHSVPPTIAIPPLPTIWGLTAMEVHDLFWEARGVSVVRVGGPIDQSSRIELFLLMVSKSMALFDPVSAADHLHWAKCKLFPVRIRPQCGAPLPSAGDRFGNNAPAAGTVWRGARRVVLTPDRELAAGWACGGATWHRMRSGVPQRRRGVLSLNGWYCDGAIPEEAARIITRIATMWDQPQQYIDRAQRVAPCVWMDTATAAPKSCGRRRSVAWLGAGHSLVPETAPYEPIVLWDSVTPAAAPALDSTH